MAKHPMLSGRFKQFIKRVSAVSASAPGRGISSSASGQRPQASTSPAKTANVQTSSSSERRQGPTRKQSGDTFWADLFLVRPWLLVGGLWLTSVAMIAIAITGLANPGREMDPKPVHSSIAGQPVSAPDAAAASRLSGDSDPETLAQRDPAATVPGTPDQAMPLWPLLVMVVACAGGCMLMSQHGLLMEQPRRQRRRTSTHLNPSVRPASPPSSGSRRQRRARRLAAQRPASQVMSLHQGKKIRHTSPQRRTTVSKPVSFNMVGSDRVTPVTVVPTHESTHLDWKEGSLAHKLDVRQTRSINSFL
ncbi:MAG: hypothetical protein F6K65_40870 [Moorea sp. SIO3C2]|nr:hypothetical protein [Moorena sp. SIO3C2]